MQIIICEDNEGMKNRLHSIAESCIIEMKEDMKCVIKSFDSSCEELDEIIKSKGDKIYILDVELKGNENGTFIAQKIRLTDRKSKIIFITSHDDEIHNILYRHIEVMDFISKNDEGQWKDSGTFHLSFLFLFDKSIVSIIINYRWLK